MIVDGNRYSHILDPRTGASFQNGPACVSVSAPHCLIAGVAATIAMLHETAQALPFLEDLQLPHLVVSQQGRISGSAEIIETKAAPRPSPANAPKDAWARA